MIVSNTTPLIYLAKLSHLSLLKELFNEVKIPDNVMEILHGKKLGFSDAGIIEKARQDGWIKIVELSDAQKNELDKMQEIFEEISETDAAAITLAKDLETNICLDDSRGVKVAETMGVKHIGTLGILLKSVEKGLMSKKQAKKLVLSLPERGFYVSHDLLTEFLEDLDQI